MILRVWQHMACFLHFAHLARTIMRVMKDITFFPLTRHSAAFLRLSLIEPLIWPSPIYSLTRIGLGSINGANSPLPLLVPLSIQNTWASIRITWCAPPSSTALSNQDHLYQNNNTIKYYNNACRHKPDSIVKICICLYTYCTNANCSTKAKYMR